jgi:hypothetical protein
MLPRPLSRASKGKLMNEIFLLREDNSGDGIYRRIGLLIGRNRWAWQSIGAAFGLAGGMLSILLGALLWIIVRFLATGHFGSFLNVVEIVFFVLTMPLLALGAYCLDLLEKRPPLLPLPANSRSDNFEQLRRFRPHRPNNN